MKFGTVTAYTATMKSVKWRLGNARTMSRRIELRRFTVGSLFSGIGGLELGLEWAGLGPVVWQCEIDPFCRSVLAKHWPDATRYTDVRAIDASAPRVDIICGGFPCQDISDAGKRAGIDGERSGLWSEFARIIGVLRPRFVVVENVSALRGRGMGRVLGDLAALGYDAEWSALRASDVGAPHQRERLFILAHAYEAMGEAGGGSEQEREAAVQRQGRGERRDHVWDVAPEPRASGVAYGLSKGLDGPRVGALGNAVVPQCAEVVGRVLLAMAEATK